MFWRKVGCCRLDDYLRLTFAGPFASLVDFAGFAYFLHHVSPTDQRRERRAEQAQSFDEKPEATRSTRSSLQEEATKCELFQLVVVCCCVAN